MARACVSSSYFKISDEGDLEMVPGTLGLREVLTFKDPGAHQFVKGDYPWLARVHVEVQGAGGGSAGANAANNQCIVRPGGAGGGFAEAVVEVSALGDVEAIVVGTGGRAGSGNSAGAAGGSSSFGGFAIAAGGDGGTANQNSGTGADAVQGVAGPLAGTGQVISGGGAGGGAIRLSATQGLSGHGGESRYGHGGVGRSTEGDGTSPRGFGGGAGGALSYGGSVDGGTGGGGLVIVRLYG